MMCLFDPIQDDTVGRCILIPHNLPTLRAHLTAFTCDHITRIVMDERTGRCTGAMFYDKEAGGPQWLQLPGYVVLTEEEVARERT